MKVRVEKINFKKDSYYYEVWSSKEKKLFSGDVWVSEQTFFSGTLCTDEEAKESAIKCANDLLKPRTPLKPLMFNQFIYEKSN